MSAAVVLPLSMYPRLRRAQGVLDRASVDLGAFPLSFDDALPACGPRGAGRASCGEFISIPPRWQAASSSSQGSENALRCRGRAFAWVMDNAAWRGWHQHPRCCCLCYGN